MSQTKAQSLVEAGSNTAIAAGVNFVAALYIYPLFGASFSITQNVELVGVFTVISVVRGYGVRRWFNQKG